MAEPLRIVSPIHKAQRQLEEYMKAASRALGVEPYEGHLLSYTTLYGPCPPSELVRVFGYKPSTLTGTLDRLEAAELVVREPNVEDRRSHLIRVTERGAEVATELRARLEDMEAEVARRVAKRDMVGFTAVLAALGDVTQVQLRAEQEVEG
jgi:DNA-binding MarR family transcriptional regulator